MRVERLPSPVRALICDFDGVLTDNRVIVREDGLESVVCDRSDGLGLQMVRDAGVAVGVLSKERNPVVAARCKKLGIECVQGIDDKLPKLRSWAERLGFGLDSVVYVGNDVNDVACIEASGCGVAVADAYEPALAAADFVLERRGGFGAVRELCDLILARRAQG
ncbi:3-deoxy-D-manno-octulosonate 8-phosphate phosphatase KdsC [Mucisphaera calidilacus]|uniref:3-deoxy-D-manno-octulosonate 8-phosphate phosphatase KdsC n=1 Tax=Mucisphaera calidilacus TaxID=2527982 RepID=A0A518BWP0_9BACT|nr:3-deoxy-D-manno-octulosonate 8-phosphate phosphatase KdsC [Mucisphaera calidilacus]